MWKEKANKFMRVSTQIVLLCILISALVVHATGGFVEQGLVTVKEAFHNTTQATQGEKVRPQSVYPFNLTGKDVKINRVSFDTMYGMDKPLVFYIGEVPYPNTWKDNNPNKGFSRLPISKAGMHKDITDKAYWGDTGITEEGKEVTVGELESINADTTKSLRLHALANTTQVTGLASLGIILQQALIGLISLFVWMGAGILKLIILLKNIDIVDVMSALNIDGISKLISDIFVVGFDKNGKFFVSPFAVIALLMFMTAIAKFTILWARGRDKRVSLWKDILLVGFVGLVIIASSVGNSKVTTLGNGFADLTNTLIATTHSDLSNNNIFYTDTSGKDANKNQDLLASETAFVNKLLIDSTLAAQFGVLNIDDLDFETLGDTNRTLAEEILTKYEVNGTKITAIDNLEDVANNLGYYFWWANSPAKTLPAKSAKIADTGPFVENKLSRVITYLQAVYDKNVEEGYLAKAHNIKNMTTSLANPNLLGSALQRILIMIVYVFLALALYKYAIKAILSKLGILLATLSLPVAGVLILTAHKNLSRIGKGMLGLFVTSLIRAMVYSLFFDAIILVVIKIVSTELVSLVVTILLLAIMMRINPTIQTTLDTVLSGVDNAVARDATRYKQKMKAWAAARMESIETKYNESERVVGYDEKGKEIREKRQGDRLSTFLGAVTSTVKDSPNGGGAIQGLYKQAKIRKKNQKASADTIDASAANLRRARYNEAVQALSLHDNEITSQVKLALSDIYNHATNKFDVTKLTEEELVEHNEIMRTDRELNALYNDKEYANLRRRVAKGLKLDARQEKAYDAFNKLVADKENLNAMATTALKESIKTRLGTSIRETNLDREKELVSRAMEEGKAFLNNGDLAGEMKRDVKKLGLKSYHTPNTATTQAEWEAYMLLMKRNQALGVGSLEIPQLTNEEKHAAEQRLARFQQPELVGRTRKKEIIETEALQHAENQRLLTENKAGVSTQTKSEVRAFRMPTQSEVTADEVKETRKQVYAQTMEPSTEETKVAKETVSSNAEDHPTPVSAEKTNHSEPQEQLTPKQASPSIEQRITHEDMPHRATKPERGRTELKTRFSSTKAPDTKEILGKSPFDVMATESTPTPKTDPTIRKPRKPIRKP